MEEEVVGEILSLEGGEMRRDRIVAICMLLVPVILMILIVGYNTITVQSPNTKTVYSQVTGKYYRGERLKKADENSGYVFVSDGMLCVEIPCMTTKEGDKEVVSGSMIYRISGQKLAEAANSGNKRD